MARTPAPQSQTIEGERTVVIPRNPPLPRKLDDLIARLFAVSVKVDIRPSGASRACDLRIHVGFTTIREGRYFGPDRILRDLRIEMCPACGAVCVRDISYDRISGLPIGRGGPRRRDMVLGWYSGKRPDGRQFS